MVKGCIFCGSKIFIFPLCCRGRWQLDTYKIGLPFSPIPVAKSELSSSITSKLKHCFLELKYDKSLFCTSSKLWVLFSSLLTALESLLRSSVAKNIWASAKDRRMRRAPTTERGPAKDSWMELGRGKAHGPSASIHRGQSIYPGKLTSLTYQISCPDQRVRTRIHKSSSFSHKYLVTFVLHTTVIALTCDDKSEQTETSVRRRKMPLTKTILKIFVQRWIRKISLNHIQILSELGVRSSNLAILMKSLLTCLIFTFTTFRRQKNSLVIVRIRFAIGACANCWARLMEL